jgi:hypothetical protein
MVGNIRPDGGMRSHLERYCGRGCRTLQLSGFEPARTLMTALIEHSQPPSSVMNSLRCTALMVNEPRSFARAASAGTSIQLDALARRERVKGGR